MKQIYYIGVDISKEKVDIAVIDHNYNVIIEKVVKNQICKLNSFFNGLLKKLKVEKEQLLVCCEETGIYKTPLQRVCVEMGLALWIELALKIKRASSSIRGKSDKQDALRIADYSCRYSDKRILYKAPSKANKTLLTLVNARESILSQITRFKQQLNESRQFDPEKYTVLKYCFQGSLNALKKQLIQVEKRIDEVVKSCEETYKNMQLLQSIPGIGRQTALQFIVYTRNFTLFESAKHLACYAGVAPFANESGIIIKKAKVSNFANKKLKKVLHMAAMASIKARGELKDYYIRKVAEGKNKMLVLNNLRNKLIDRMFAVVKRKSGYILFNLEKSGCILT